jgi:hypothetical protein
LRASGSETLATPLVLPVDAVATPDLAGQKNGLHPTQIWQIPEGMCVNAAAAGDPVHVDKHVQMF